MSQQAPLTPFENALAGALGGVFSNAVIYPLDTVKTHIQADKNSKKEGEKVATGDEKRKGVKKQLGIVETLISIIRSKQGPTALYRGFGASMANTFIQQFAYFYWYTLVRSLYIRRILGVKEGAAALSTVMELTLGAIAAAFSQLFTTPVGVIATRQQIGSDGSGDNTFVGHIKEIYEHDGVTGFWRGLRPSLVLCINPAITYGVFERAKTVILAASGDQMTPGKSFVIGALSKTLATIVTFPYILSKVRLQTKNTPYLNAFEVLGHIFKEKGISGWYQGMHAQITKAVLSQALLFYFRDYFEIWTRQLLAFYGKKP
ncbi:hypothetical protein MVES1_002486 [Malassezia vespertilionis]|uniref:Ant1p n=1 Tax=Malassezia vespertilionis TaxID=2020962 RepID=A0A2N1JA39_9BASI|nr:uncharacterized protein MVES1_002486 [Malassezia vespertilionis]PKI83421.1 Ant1p [Malassezia vespertilionis]WFD07129.1 hypothetical protein MVES1_002486 [Malassezia vespertilionis]